MSREPNPMLRPLRDYAQRPILDLSPEPATPDKALARYLLFVLMPLWTGVGVLDWFWHKRTDIEHTAGIQESLIHLLMFSEVGVPIILGLLCEINAALLAAMAAGVAAHSATAVWDVRYATDLRAVKTGEQHTHSFLEVLPIMALSMTACLHYDQVRSIFGGGSRPADWSFRLKRNRLPLPYLAGIAGLIVGGILLPFSNEVWRCWRARKEPHYNAALRPQAETTS